VIRDLCGKLQREVPLSRSRQYIADLGDCATDSAFKVSDDTINVEEDDRSGH